MTSRTQNQRRWIFPLVEKNEVNVDLRNGVEITAVKPPKKS